MKVTKVESKSFKPEAVEIREPLVDDLIAAERISGKSQGFEFLSAVASQVCTFDGVKQPPEEVRRLSSKDFLSLADELDIADVQTLPSAPSTLSEKESGEKNE